MLTREMDTWKERKQLLSLSHLSYPLGVIATHHSASLQLSKRPNRRFKDTGEQLR